MFSFLGGDKGGDPETSEAGVEQNAPSFSGTRWAQHVPDIVLVVPPASHSPSPPQPFSAV